MGKALKLGDIDISIVTEYVTVFEKLEKFLPDLKPEMLQQQRHWLGVLRMCQWSNDFRGL